MTDTFLPGPFAKTPFGLLAADTTGAASGPVTGSVTDGTLDLTLELRHRDGRRVRTEARLVVLGSGRDALGRRLPPRTHRADGAGPESRAAHPVTR